VQQNDINKKKENTDERMQRLIRRQQLPTTTNKDIDTNIIAATNVVRLLFY
jgi:hypothetical protein